ncbi:ribose-phosphate diphosphokinase [Patescibacteria group bacterium]|nr:ribose-phosphate diphosphokinase [Patescibacteria group bacterium]MBU4367862.1 ribose-phosphate diphosphokinase [Patescibacteria group bacterium]MBU4461683.1 ribose-phosphate diphosphokinase [Patescibacteria group bacterium]MCG2700304.1 ribose-phosphate diphosphokinase [Candidatus Parcubacteria bacterium]
MKPTIIFTSTTKHLIKNLKRKMRHFEFILPDKNKEGKGFFPDREVYVRISQINNLKNKRVIILHSGAPNPNEGLIELELILQILKDHKIKPELFFTYFPYGQQDRVFQRGETNAAESLVKKLIDYYKVKKIYIIDPHFGKMGWIKKYPIISVSATSFLIEKAKKDFGQNILFISPDKGGKRRTGIIGLKKKRIDSFRLESFSSKIVVKGKIIGIVDDILETGGTILKSYKVIKKSGGKKIILLITHGLLDSGIKRVKNKFSKIYLTNTINRKEANVDITNLISNVI